MSLEALFSAASTLALLGWLGLIAGFLLRRDLVMRIAGRVVPGLLALAYVGVLAAGLVAGPAVEGGGFSSLAAVQRLFADPRAMLAGWIHYLCFDLMVGHWIAAETRRLGLPGWVLVPALPLTFLFGPLGLLVFFAARTALAPHPPLTGARP